MVDKEMDFQKKESAKLTAELVIANKELAFQNEEKEKRAAELVIANKELAFQNEEKEKRAAELVIANKELAFQNEEKEKRAAELVIANKELAFQHEEKEKRAAELVIAYKELAFQHEEKEKRAAELIIANKELALKEEKIKRAADLKISAIRALKNEKKLRASFMGTIRVASLLVELRDPYTAGHQRHVGDLAKAIAADLGFDSDYQEGIMISGYLHDIGKIIVPIEILSKPGKLSPEEFNLIKNHVQAGYDILNGLTLPWNIARGIFEHHERLDGSGYPRRLKGDEISIDGRILAVADVVDAMSSLRPYRTALGIEKALDEIERGRDTLYDATVVDVCLKLFQDKSYQLGTGSGL